MPGRLPSSGSRRSHSLQLARPTLSSPRRLAPAALALVVLVLAVVGVGCPCLRSAVNASPEVRWWLFSNFGASKVCPEVQKRGVPIKLGALGGGASVGRFFPRECRV